MIRQRDNSTTFSTAARPRPAFTVVELVIVITVIALLLLISIPGLSKMATDSRFSAAVQSLNGVLTRTYYQSLADMNFTAVRIGPGNWDHGDDEAHVDREHMHAVPYRYGPAYDSGANNNVPVFDERFGRIQDDSVAVLPSDVWAAPIETLGLNSVNAADDDFADQLLTGQAGHFEANSDSTNTRPSWSNQSFFPADDFLIVFDPQAGVRQDFRRPSNNRNSWDSYALRTIDKNPSSPRYNKESNIWRYGSIGVILYPREAFLALGDNADSADRAEFLRQQGRPYFVHRYGGELVMGAQAKSSE